MAIDLFALSLKLQTDGTSEAQRALASVDAAGKQAATSLTSTEGAASRLSASSTQASGSLGSMGKQLVSATAQSIGLSGSIGNVIGNLAQMAGPVAIGFAAGAAIIKKGYDLISEGARQIKEDSDKAIVSIQRMLHESALGRNFALKDQISAINAEINEQLHLIQVAKDHAASVGMKQIGEAATAEVARLRRIRDQAEGELQLREATERADEAMKAFNETNIRAATVHTRAASAAREHAKATHQIFEDPFENLKGPMPNIKASSLPDLNRGVAGERKAIDEAVAAAVEEADRAAKGMQQQLAGIFGNALVNGIMEGFQGGGLGGALKSLASTLLEGFGSICIQIGEQVIAASALMAKVVAFLIANPLVALAGGIALVALGSAIGGHHGNTTAQGGFIPSSGSNFGQGTENVVRFKFIDRSGNLANVSAPRPINIWNIGTNDPKAQRDLAYMVEKASRQNG